MADKPLTEMHNCPYAIIRCMDFRNVYGGAMVDFARRHLSSEGLCDLISTAGPAKKLANCEKHEVILDDLGIAVEKHHVRHVFLLTHTDCGYYGGSAAFDSPEEERATLEEDLRRARQTLLEAFPELKVHLFLTVYRDQEIDFLKVAA